MEIRLLRYFIAIANEESISHAAELLHVTQPTLSRQMSEFEEELGEKLFIRGNRKVTLTDKGVLLYEKAREIIELTDKAEREIKESNEVINGKIVIGSGVALATTILSKLVKKFRELYPLVHIELITGTVYQIKGKMDKGLIDVGLFIKPNSWSDYETIVLDSEDRYAVLMRKDAKWSNQKYVTANDLKEMVLSVPRTLDSKFYMDTFGKPNEKLNIIATHDIINNAAVFVEDGIYNAITLEMTAKDYHIDNLCCIPIYPEVKTQSSLSWKKHYNFSTTVQRFIEFIKQELVKNNE